MGPTAGSSGLALIIGISEGTLIIIMYWVLGL
jgi:hypothetical protein